MVAIPIFKRVWALALALTLAVFIADLSASAESWRFGVMSDTQWTVPDDGYNPNTVAVGLIKQINAQFIHAGVKFVIQVGDLVDTFSNPAVASRASAAQTLYDAGIGFYPLRGNHEGSKDAALSFQTVFPQTQGKGFHVFGAANFSSPAINLTGLSYSFDYNNARFVLLDQFTRTDGTGSTNTNIIDQQNWLSSTLAGKTAGSHGFVFSHKNLIGENHKDVLFGADPTQNPDARNAFLSSLQANGVRYAISGHDHIHQRSIITSPDGKSRVHEIISGSDSSKFYIPLNPSNDATYDNPTRETSISQERNTVGYYIYTVDGPRVQVDYYSSVVNPTLDSGEYLIYNTPILTFSWRESFGYSLNGKEFLVAQGESYDIMEDSYAGTTARILGGTNGSTGKEGSGRALTKAVDTGWSSKSCCTASNILTLWGMTDRLGSRQTDVYTLSMSYAPRAVKIADLRKGLIGLATRDETCNWVNAVDRNIGGTKRFVLGPWDTSFGLGTFGVDQKTKTAWAVINYESDFAVAPFSAE